MALSLSSPVFAHNGAIPRTYTCQGKDISPALRWSELPNGTKSVALIVDDPDAPDPAAPKRVWVHWVLYNIPPDSTGLPESVDATRLPAGTAISTSSTRSTSYCRTSGSRPRRRCSRRCKGTSWKKPS
jgi:Raf kinase inhibitor-like YbhB/YbcL family protein